MRISQCISMPFEQFAVIVLIGALIVAVSVLWVRGRVVR